MADEFNQMKMEALKKVFAEIILNTSKEAATRVMVAERKARSFEQQLATLKEESVSMLLRLKDYFTSTIVEAEARSLEQQTKIEELEAQLSEAEGITVDLRGELRHVQEKLEIMRRNQKKSSNDHGPVISEPVEECVRRDAPNSSIIPQVADCEEKFPSLQPTTISNMFCDTVKSASLSVKSQLNQLHAPNDVLSPIIMQNREANHFRNGCTQRIRALEGNLSDDRVLTAETEDQKFRLSMPSITNADDIVKHRQHEIERVECCKESLHTSKPDENIPSRQLIRHSSSYKDHPIRTLRRSTRKCSRCRDTISSLQSSRKKFGRKQLRSFLSPLKGCSNVVNMQAVDIPINVVEMDPKKFRIGSMSESHDLSSNNGNAVCAQKEDGEIHRNASSDKIQNVLDEAPMDSVLVDVPISEGFGSRHNQLAGENRFLKFTFHRKRRRNVLRKMDENILHDRAPINRRLETPIDVVAEDNSLKDQMIEDNDKMQQVAHQLIELTGAGC